MLVSGRSFLHYCYSMQTEDGSRSHLKLGACLLISAEMPESFLLQYTAMAHLLIIQEECCGFLMYCCRAFFGAIFLWCVQSSLLLCVYFLLHLALRPSIPLTFVASKTARILLTGFPLSIACAGVRVCVS